MGVSCRSGQHITRQGRPPHPVRLTSCAFAAAVFGDVAAAAAAADAADAAAAASTLSFVEPDDDRALSFITRERNSSRSLKPEGTR